LRPSRPFEGFRRRTAKGLGLYITDAPEDHVSKVWFDDVVVATEYVGPIRRMKQARQRL
jgi:hypothetical protein